MQQLTCSERGTQFQALAAYFLVGGSYGNKILYKNLDLTQEDFPNNILFHFLWVKMLPKK